MRQKNTIAVAFVLTILMATAFAQGYNTKCSTDPFMGTVNCETNPSGGRGGGYVDLMAFQRGAETANMQNHNDSLMQQNMQMQQLLMQQQLQYLQQYQPPSQPSYQLGQLRHSWNEVSVKVCVYIPSSANAFTVNHKPQADWRLKLKKTEDCAPKIMLSLNGDYYKPLR
jgi:hypothetical protein